MKTLVERLYNGIKRMNPSANVGDGLSILFTVLGNGYELNTAGYINNNYKCDEIYDFPEPHPLTFIYPYDKKREFQPFYKLRGCRDIGFNETLIYFIKCLEISDSNNADIALWQKNIGKLKAVLKVKPIQPDIIDKNDMEKFLAIIKDDKCTYQAPKDGTVLDPKNSVYKVWFFDVQWSDCPYYVQSEVKDIWKFEELGNDNYFSKHTLDDQLFERYPRIYMWLKHKGVQENEKVAIHWWW